MKLFRRMSVPFLSADAGLNPIEFLKNADRTTWIILASCLVGLILLILVIRALCRRIYRRRGYRRTRGYRGYRGK